LNKTVIKHDKQTLELINKILDQNEMILRVNVLMIEKLSSQLTLVTNNNYVRYDHSEVDRLKDNFTGMKVA
jgi:hypothetical protein